MSRTVLVLLAVVALVSLAQWASARTATHLDPRLIPLRSRRRVARLLSASSHLQLACAVVAAGVVCGQIAAVLG